MNARAVERQSIEESLRRGLERRELALHYQPKIQLTTGGVIGAEALIRWTHPTRGSVSPGQFISIAEACGLMLPIGAWVLREACGQARAWADQGLPACSMTVNVCAREFLDETFADRLSAILGETGLDPKFLELDVTENILMRRPGATAPILQALRNSGVQVAIDDFGTGDFGLSHLQKFSVDAVKIDSSLVRQIGAAGKDAEVVTAAIAMARGLKLRVVAEGVETAEALDFLRARHCDEAQGYYFSPPLPASQFAELLEAGIGGGISPGRPALLAG
jgi:EAL domain-containing protein (putative c-di-GMP-specific phosphodiesterase class I)